MNFNRIPLLDIDNFVLFCRLADFFLDDQVSLNVCLRGNHMKARLMDIRNKYFKVFNGAKTDDEPIIVYDKLINFKFRIVRHIYDPIV